MDEIRGAETYSFLQAGNTGHPGSMSTFHADTPHGAYERLAMVTMQAASVSPRPSSSPSCDLSSPSSSGCAAIPSP
jgi:Flp pilus assembly CpaF family ATPase